MVNSIAIKITKGLSGAIALGLVACVPLAKKPPQLATTPIAANPVSPSAVPNPTPTLSVELDRPFERAVDKAASAVAVERTAAIQQDWQLAAFKWQQAIALLNQVPKASPNAAAAQKLLPSYQQGFQRAQQFAKQSSTQSPSIAKGSTTKSSAKDDVLLVTGLETTQANAVTGSEGVLALNQQQLAFFTKQKRFASSLTELTNKPATSPSYSFNTTSIQPTQAMSTAVAKQPGLLSYTGAVFMLQDATNQDRPVSIVCATAKPAIAPPAMPELKGSEVTCPAGSTLVSN
jgi:Type IV pilin-like G and H, putative